LFEEAALQGIIYKVASRAAFEASMTVGSFTGMPVDAADGFIHFSTAAQLGETLRRHFAGEDDLVLFAVATDGLGDLRWEPSRGGELFPHLYGALPMARVGRSAPLSVAADGSAELPDWVA
jgi:uncharacterized protein (DUF952 family)